MDWAVASTDNEREQPSGDGMTRRNVLAAAGFMGIGAGLDRVLVSSSSSKTGTTPRASGKRSVPFYGIHQAGIATPAPEFLSFAAFDIVSDAVEDLLRLLQNWTFAAVSLTSGKPYWAAGGAPDLAPADPGEAVGLGSSGLTLTVGFGPTMFGIDSPDRFGFAPRRPKALLPLPTFQGESLDSHRSGGDLCVQACADDPQVAFHAIHVLMRIASGTASLRWMQEGFGRTSSASRSQPTPRNLMGFKDGTRNIRGEDGKAMNEHVWVQAGDGPVWMKGGSYLVARRIKILLDVWDATSLDGQELAIGRKKLSGAPIGAEDEFDQVDLDAEKDGEPTIPADAHIRLSSPESNNGMRILRRGYSFSESPEPGSGQIDAGLFFISFQRDPHRQFVPIQRRLAASDALNRHIVHSASAMFACPPGTRPGSFIGEGLFA